MHVDTKDRFTAFVEKPKDPPGIPDNPTWRSPPWASTSSKREFLAGLLRRDAADKKSSRDFGKDIILYVVKNGKAVAHRFAKSCVRSISKPVPTGAMWEPSMLLGGQVDLTDTVRRSTFTTTIGDLDLQR